LKNINKGDVMKMEIKSWLTGNALYSAEAENIKKLLMSAIKAGVNLSRADLYGANLSGANLSGADLSHANLSHANLFGMRQQNNTTPLLV
jgi:uncharacterized protein YjbI with pentapeptide repeats